MTILGPQGLDLGTCGNYTGYEGGGRPVTSR